LTHCLTDTYPLLDCRCEGKEDKMIQVLALVSFTLSSCIPKPDIFSIDLVSLQGGIFTTDYPGEYKPDGIWALGFSGGRIRSYWKAGKSKIAFCLGFEACNGNLFLDTSSGEYRGLNGSSETLTPQIGIALLGIPRDLGLVSNPYFVPRLELITGVSFLSPVFGDSEYTTVKTELVANFIPAISYKLEHRYIDGYTSTVTAMIYLNFGLNNVKTYPRD